MKKSIIDQILSTTGYLPPRNEEEMIAFEKVYSSVTVNEDSLIDVSRIVNEVCPIRPTIHIGGSPISASDIRMAARNYEAMPRDVIDKIKNQHKGEDD